MNRVGFSLGQDELGPIIQVLQDTLLNRPEIDEYDPYVDIDEAIDAASPFFDAFRYLIAVQGEGLDSQVMMSTALGVRDGYQAFWQRPFPEGLEAGQLLFSAVMEKPIRELIRFLTMLASRTSKDIEACPEPSLVLDPEEEMARFQAWREEQEEKQSRYYSSTSSKGFGLGTLALAFGLGWLLGDDE